MEKDLVSVIVPCYNVEKFLDDCLKSIEAQTYKNFEVIFVNDGSKDNTLQILKNFCEKKENCFVIDQQNTGLSGARNTGIAHAKGEFVYFMDSDDYIDPITLEVLVREIKETQSDFVTFMPKWVKEKATFEKTKRIRPKKNFKRKFYNGADTIMSYYFSRKLGFTVCCKLFRHEIIKQLEGYPNLFNVNTKYSEDIEFNIAYIEKSNKAVFIPLKLYFYRQRNGSYVHSPFSEKKLTVFNAFERAEKLDKEKFKDSQTYIQSHKCVVCLEMLFRISRSKFREGKAIKKLYQDFKAGLKFVTKGKLNPFYLKFLPCVTPYFKLKFRKQLKKDKT